MGNYHKLYYSFFWHYHRQEYWEAHEVLEELWQTQRENDFYHGLIQIAAIMHQLERGKIRGARKLATSATRYLQPHAPTCDEVDVQIILDWLQRCLQILPDDRERIEPKEVKAFGLGICPLPQFSDKKPTSS